jgi:hypothetical protein
MTVSATKDAPRLVLSHTPNNGGSKALGFLPKLTAEIGFALVGREDVSVEILPGQPTTVAFSAGGQLLSLMVLPMGENQARHLLGLPLVRRPDVATDGLWEEEREVPATDAYLDGMSF